ncbi:MAG: ROK family protein [Desulfobacteraceae bacterium]|jgi:fructokinase
MVQNMFRIGIDLGGTKTEVILLDASHEVLHRKRMETPVSSGYDAIVKSLYDLIIETAKKLSPGSEYTIGIGIPGSINSDTGLVQNANTTCLIGKPLKKDIEHLLGREIGVENDANCFTLAEAVAGAGQGYRFVFGVIMGTGCGGGICIDETVRKGRHSISGEWGHFSVDPEGVECYCGNRGCIETKISGSGVEKSYFQRYGTRLTMHDIIKGYRKGEPSCVASFECFIEDFGRCLGGLISTLDPDAVVLGGGLSNIPELYKEGFEKIKKYAFHSNLKTPLLRNKLGDSAGVFGAAWIGK